MSAEDASIVESEVEDLGHIRLKSKPPVDPIHDLDTGQVHKVIRMHGRGWWIQGDGEPVLILAREAEKCEASA